MVYRTLSSWKKQDFLKALERHLERSEEEHRKILDKIAALHVEAEAKSEQILLQQDKVELVKAEVKEVCLRMAEGGKGGGLPPLGGTAASAAGTEPAGVSKEEFALVLASRAAKRQAAELALLEGAAAAQHAAEVAAAAEVEAAAAAAESFGHAGPTGGRFHLSSQHGTCKNDASRQGCKGTKMKGGAPPYPEVK